MTENERPAFASTFAEWTSLYPNAFIHEGSLTSYWNHLRLLPLATVRKALLVAMKASPEKLPTAETVRQLAELEAKRLREQPRRNLLAGDVEPAFGLPSNHPAMLLAKEFEDESRFHGLDPDRPPPHEITMRRIARIKEVLGMDLSKLAKSEVA